MKRKLAVFGLCFALAELAAAALPPPAVLVAAAVVLLAAGCAAALWRRRARALVLPVAAGLALGLVWSAGYRFLVTRSVLALAGQTVTATATVEPGCAAAYQEGMLRGTLRLEGIPGQGGSVLVQCWGFPAQAAGERFTAEFSLAALPDDVYRPGNYADGLFLQAEYLGGYTALPAAHHVRFWLYELRQKLCARLGTWLPRLYAGLEAAMLLGERSLLSDTVRRMFQTAGVAHLLAVSGLHVALLCGLFGLGGGTADHRFSRPRIALRAALVLFYMALTGFPVSVFRAGTAFLFALAGMFLLQPPDYLTSMGLAALLLGLQNAYAPCDVGFQLSFCAVLGVQGAAALDRWQRTLPKRDAEGELAPAAERLLRLLALLETTLFATLATLPVLVAQGMAVSGVAVLSNLLVVWMLRPALLLGLLVLALSALPVLAPCMHMASLLLAAWLRLMLVLVRWCAALPAAQLDLPRRYTLWVLAVLAALALFFWLRRRHTAMFWYLPAAAVCCAAAVALGVLLGRDTVTVALVGTAGNPCAVITQNGQTTVLYRGGAANRQEVAEYLGTHGRGQPALLVDIRTQPQAFEELAGQTLVMAEQDVPYMVYPLSDTLTLHLYHLSGGNLAVVDAGGTRVAMMAGSIELDAPVQVDAYCAGSGYPHAVAARTVLTNSTKLRWLAEYPGAELLYGSGTPTAVIRPGRSIFYEEAKRLAVQ